MSYEFEEIHTESQPSVSIQHQDFDSPRQVEIYRNLKVIGPEIAAFYINGVKILQDKDNEIASYQLAHIAREIDGGLRDVLTNTQDKKKIQKRLSNEDIGDLKDRIGHIASILSALGIDDLRTPLARKWINVATKFHQFAHRHGPWKTPRSKDEFIPLWYEFEDVLVDLVGTHFKLLDRIDHFLDYKEPTKEIIETLPNILTSNVRYAYFFKKLDSPDWLKPLKETGWFHPDSQPTSQETPDRPVHFWHALGYVEKVANLTNETPYGETISILADIVNTIVNYTHDTETSITSDHTDSQVIKILCTLPIERIESQHITFIGVALKSNIGATLLNAEIGETVLPKLLDEGADKLILELLDVMLDSTVINGGIYPVMQEYWLRETLNEHGNAIGKKCGIGAAQIGIAHICNLIDEGTYSFNLIQEVEISSSDTSHEDYAEILVNFVSCIFRHAKSDSIADTVQELLNESHEIVRRIAINVIKNHYDDLKYLFWDWQGNPLEETLLQPELYQLINSNCTKFNGDEIELILHWIESANYTTSAEDKKTRVKQIAYRKRGWLSALLKTDDQRVITLYQKYEKINPAKLDHPGLLWWTQTWSGETSPITVKELLNKSNTEIVNYLNGFKTTEPLGPTVPTEEGLRQTFEECVATNPQKFSHDLLPFYNVTTQYQSSLFQGLRKAWVEKTKFDWSHLLEFIYNFLSSQQFRDEPKEGRFNYKDWTIAAIAELLLVGIQNDENAFDPKFLPMAEDILLILSEKVKSDRSVIDNAPITVLNSTPAKVYSALINYALRFARVQDDEQGSVRWPVSIKSDFTIKLDQSVESSYELLFTLGRYLSNLLYLDERWVIDNINLIFPQHDENLWQAAFTGYMFNSGIYEDLYLLVKKHGNYDKALVTDFTDTDVTNRLVTHICTGWIEDSETLKDKSSIIFQLINSDKPNLLSTMVHFFWRQRDNLPEKIKVKVRPTWRALYESLTQKTDIAEYRDVLSRLSGWVALVDKIDEEVIKWLKFSVKHIKEFSDSAFFIEDLLQHVTKTPAEVGNIYLYMLSYNVYPIYNQEHIQEIVRILYNKGHKEVADRICNLYGEAGFDFLRSLYDENQN
ncbi:MAG: hypothetical protein OXD54_12560 [Candidatus Poribacteria bacterium]|nr:hypothetical protein [Candidatus Poribacteria bacterium]